MGEGEGEGGHEQRASSRIAIRGALQLVIWPSSWAIELVRELSTRCCLDNLNLNFAKLYTPTSSTVTIFCLKNYPPVGGMSLQQSSALLLIQI